MIRCHCGAPIVNGHHCTKGHLQERAAAVVRRRLSFEQLGDWRNAMRLNFSAREPAKLADLRRIHRNIKGGAQYGRSSGYAP